jgi:hypothetical protein
MEKYIDGWNAVSRTYISRLQREGVNMGASSTGGDGMQGQGEGKEMF